MGIEKKGNEHEEIERADHVDGSVKQQTATGTDSNQMYPNIWEKFSQNLFSHKFNAFLIPAST